MPGDRTRIIEIVKKPVGPYIRPGTQSLSPFSRNEDRSRRIELPFQIKSSKCHEGISQNSGGNLLIQFNKEMRPGIC